ncbi:hypothetical protein [Polaromonas sp.]|uniref:hypothetical protein n=1 Tax=Polaromonas sp. TaxID=1869339 RepID=UPI0032639BA9
MSWITNLPTLQQWDASIAAATDSVGDRYATTFLSSPGLQMQVHATVTGNLLHAQLRTKLTACHAATKVNLPPRIAELDKLIVAIDEFLRQYTNFSTNARAKTWITNTARHALVRRLGETAAVKRRYLEMVRQGLEQRAVGAALIVQIVNRRFGFSGPGRTRLVGLDKSYWIERDHPMHGTTQVNRSLGALWGEWERLVRENATALPFFLWLEEVDYSFNNKTVNEPEVLVEYLRQGDLAAYALTSHGGRVLRPRSRTDLTRVRYDTQAFHDGMATFVIAPPVQAAQPVVYSEQHERGLFHHSSFMAGEQVVSAGMLRCHDGIITALSPKSGHYKPGFRDFMTAIGIFRAQNLINDGTVIELDQFYESLYKTKELKGLDGALYLARVQELGLRRPINLSQDEFAAWAAEVVTEATAAAVLFHAQAQVQHQQSLTQAAAELAMVRLRYPKVLRRVQLLAEGTTSVTELARQAKLSEEWRAAIALGRGFTEEVGMRVVRLVSRRAKKSAVM